MLDKVFKASGIQFRLVNTIRIIGLLTFLSKRALFLLLSVRTSVNYFALLIQAGTNCDGATAEERWS